MTEDGLKEKLCLLLDGELSQEEALMLLSRIETDPALRAQWRRYCLISEAMRSKSVLLPDSHFVDRISTALAEEPTVLAPRSTTPRPYREKVVTAALAAALTAVAVLAGKSLHDYSPLHGAEFLAKAELNGANAQSSIDPEFRDYLVAHYETAYLAGAQGMLPSVRLVSSDSAR